jgi:alpha-tubulin suppressor-like RCC1 family protein
MTKIACGNNHSLALSEDGKVFTWGSGKSGENDHTLALSEDGKVFTWGSGKSGIIEI